MASRNLREQMWRDLEAEYGEPIRDIILGYRQLGYTWRTIAGALGISCSGLRKWRIALGLSLQPQTRICYARPNSPLQRKARNLGFESFTDAVLHYRLIERLTVKETAERLDCCRDSVTSHTPNDLNTYNQSDHGREVKRKHAAWLNAPTHT